MDAQQLNDLLRPLLLPDLRTECRARKLNPGGGREALLDRVRQDMIETQNYKLFKDSSNKATTTASTQNNYSRPEGQNVGNFMTDRNSSRVSKPPGGMSQISFGGDEERPVSVKTKLADVTSPSKHLPPPASPGANSVNSSPRIAAHNRGNNYHRSEGQNVGNFLTDRNSSRVMAPPGGHSNITFG